MSRVVPFLPFPPEKELRAAGMESSLRAHTRISFEELDLFLDSPAAVTEEAGEAAARPSLTFNGSLYGCLRSADLVKQKKNSFCGVDFMENYDGVLALTNWASNQPTDGLRFRSGPIARTVSSTYLIKGGTAPCQRPVQKRRF